jgi:chromosomal replication initiation ATPase DnaA
MTAPLPNRPAIDLDSLPQPITLSTRHFVPPEFVQLVAARHGITVASLVAKRRDRAHSDVRLLLYWLLDSVFGCTRFATAEFFQRHHTAITSGLKTVANIIETEPNRRAEIEQWVAWAQKYKDTEAGRERLKVLQGDKRV